MACTFWTCHTCRANTRTLVWYSVLFNSKVKNWTWHNSYWQTHNYSSSHVYGMEYDFAVQLYQLICMEKSPSIVFEAIWKLIGAIGFLCDERSSCCTWGLLLYKRLTDNPSQWHQKLIFWIFETFGLMCEVQQTLCEQKYHLHTDKVQKVCAAWDRDHTKQVLQHVLREQRGSLSHFFLS